MNIKLGFFRAIGRVFGLKPVSDFQTLLQENDRLRKSLVDLDHSISDPLTGSGTLGQFYSSLQTRFIHYKEDFLSGKDVFEDRLAIASALNSLDERMQRFPDSKEYHHSVGMEGGTHNVVQAGLRIKVLPKGSAALASKINHHYYTLFPQNIMFGESFEKAYFPGDFYVEENFEGAKLLEFSEDSRNVSEIKAPLDVVKNHLEITYAMLKHQPTIPYHVENYRKKISENLATLLMIYELSPDTIKWYVSLANSLESRALDPWIDNSLFNSKYESGIIKEFDFSKAETRVIQDYEAVQIGYGYGEPSLFKELSEKYSSCSDFETNWELGAIYYLTRQIRNTAMSTKLSKKMKDYMINRYEKMLVAEKSDATPQAQLLKKDIIIRPYKGSYH